MRLSIRILALAVLSNASLAGAQQSTSPLAAPPRAELVSRLDSLTREFVQGMPSAGLTAAVIRGADTLLLTGAGERDRERRLPAERGTVYRLGSITKQFTSAAVMRLVESGRLRLADTLGTLLPQYPQWSRVTLRQLLNHTSGIHSYTSVPEWQSTWANDLTPAQVVAIVERDTLDFAPGTLFRYNNTGYVLLGMILERVTGRSYAEHLRETMFAPLGLKSGAYCPSRPTDGTYASGYSLSGGRLTPAEYLSMTHPHAAGALCMSVPDYLRWQTALTSGIVVSPASYALMSSADTIANGMRTGYGFGLAPGRLGTHAVVRHGGGINGFSTAQLWLPDDSLRVVVFANTAGANTDMLATNLGSAVLGLPLRSRPAAPVAVPLAASERAKYEGLYDLQSAGGRTRPIRVFLDGDALMAQAEGPGQGRIPLIYQGGNAFAAAFDPTMRLVILFENGKAVKAQLTQRGATTEGPRRP